MPSHPTVHLRGVAVLLLCGLPACFGQESGPPLVVQRDSAGIRIVEAKRPLWGDSSLWSIDPDPVVDLTVSGSGTPHEFFRVRGVKQRSDGSLLVADRGSQQVRLFSGTGQFQGSAGGPGDGPGEFRNLRMVETVGDKILALDQTRGRITVLEPDLTLVHTFEVSSTTFVIHDMGDGRILVESFRVEGDSEPGNQVVGRPTALLRYDLEGARVDSLGEACCREEVFRMIGGGPIMGPPLFGKQGQVATRDEAILHGSTDLMEVQEFDLTGQVVRILRIPDYPLELTEDQISAERDAQLNMDLPPGMTLPPPIRQFFEELPAPATRPAYANMLVDPSGAVWLELYRGMAEQDRPQEWLILDADGTWLGTVEVPDRFSVTDITRESVLGVWRDELDVEHPQMLRLDREGS